MAHHVWYRTRSYLTWLACIAAGDLVKEIWRLPEWTGLYIGIGIFATAMAWYTWRHGWVLTVAAFGFVIWITIVSLALAIPLDLNTYAVQAPVFNTVWPFAMIVIVVAVLIWAHRRKARPTVILP